MVSSCSPTGHLRDDGGRGTYCTTFHTIRPDGSDERQLAGGCALWRRELEPDGRRHHHRQPPLVVSTTQISRSPPMVARACAADAGGGDLPAFSPDGSQMAYAGVEMTPESGGIFIADADGTHPRQLTSPLDATRSLTRSHVSRRMARAPCSPGLERPRRTTTGTDEVWLVNTDGTRPASADRGAVFPSSSAHWSPTARSCCSRARRCQRLHVRTACGPSPPTVPALTPVSNGTGSAAHNHVADWSPDGSRVGFTHLEAYGIAVAQLPARHERRWQRRHDPPFRLGAAKAGGA